MCDGFRKYKELIKPLVAYSCDKFDNMNKEKLFLVRIIYETIREAIADLHQKRNKKLRMSAMEYFCSELYLKHCLCVGISPLLMTYIVNNPEKYLDKLLPYVLEEKEHESFVE